MASSRVEGCDVSSLDLAREEAVAIADRDGPFGLDDLLAIHATLMAGEERARPGRVREQQNWIGGRLGNPSGSG